MTAMAKQLAKKANTLPSELRTHTQEEDVEALKRIRLEPEYRPLNVIVQLDFAAQAEQYLEWFKYSRLTPNRRAQVYKICGYLCEPSNFSNSQTDMLRELGFAATVLKSIELRWPYFWDFVNLVVHRAMVQRHSARVDMATTEHAIQGSDRDRRLYYEVFKGLKRGHDPPTGPSTIVFVNNVINRPEVEEEAITVQTASGAELSAKPLEPSTSVDLSLSPSGDEP